MFRRDVTRQLYGCQSAVQQDRGEKERKNITRHHRKEPTFGDGNGAGVPSDGLVRGLVPREKEGGKMASSDGERRNITPHIGPPVALLIRTEGKGRKKNTSTEKAI